MGYISIRNQGKEKLTRYAVEYIDKTGKKLEDTFEAKSLVDLAHKLYDKGAKDILIVFTEKEIHRASYRAREVEKHMELVM